MTRTETVAQLRAERTEIAELLASLSDQDWQEPSLCDGWSVLDVAAHLASVVGLSRRGLMMRTVRHGAGSDRANARSAAAFAALGPDALVEAIADPDLLGLGFFQPRWAVCEAVVHHQDIRRALGRARSIPPERLQIAIDVLLAMPFLTGRARSQRRISIVAPDIDLERGNGPGLQGPGEAIAMVLAGRLDALPELSGDAVALFEPVAPN
ncbi:MAG: maleylpyruvate isomerase family mycothiol-dependent enzyme [Actinomycetota bacterium]